MSNALWNSQGCRLIPFPISCLVLLPSDLALSVILLLLMVVVVCLFWWFGCCCCCWFFVLFLFSCFRKVSNKVCVKLNKGEIGVKMVLLDTYSELDDRFPKVATPRRAVIYGLPMFTYTSRTLSRYKLHATLNSDKFVRLQNT